MSATQTTVWTAEHVAAISGRASTTAPLISRLEVTRMVPGLHLWDLWPVRNPDGTVPSIGGGELWMGLSAPADRDPRERHDLARLRLVLWREGRWHDCGPVFPDGASLGSREWAGSAVYDDGRQAVTVFYTAAGRRGEPRPTYVQRIAQATARIALDGTCPRLVEWSAHREVMRADGGTYVRAEEERGEPGFIKAFRDPFFWRDPASRRDYLLFTASLASAETDFNGAVGVAVRPSDQNPTWTLLPPLLHADGVNNELERPHVVVRDGCYYLFFSTQRRTFHPSLSGPTGLYGFVGQTLLGPYEPLNGSGLVLRNPPEEPFQAYSWLVLNDLRAVSFVDAHSLEGKHPDDLQAAGIDARRHFGGTIAPVLRLVLDGTRAWIDGATPQEERRPARDTEP
jgi:levansucrase